MLPNLALATVRLFFGPHWPPGICPFTVAGCGPLSEGVLELVVLDGLPVYTHTQQTMQRSLVSRVSRGLTVLLWPVLHAHAVHTVGRDPLGYSHTTPTKSRDEQANARPFSPFTTVLRTKTTTVRDIQEENSTQMALPPPERGLFIRRECALTHRKCHL